MWPARGDLGKEYNVVAPRGGFDSESPHVTINNALKDAATMVRAAKGDPAELASIVNTVAVSAAVPFKDIKDMKGFKDLQTALNGKNAFHLSIENGDAMISIVPGKNFSESTINGQKVIPPKVSSPVPIKP